MEISRREAYRILSISEGASHDEIRAAYKKQALLWHPDKHENSPAATKKFQEISSAYERLTKPEEVEISLTMEQMFDLFSHVFLGRRGPGGPFMRHPYHNGYYHSDSDSSGDFMFKPEPFRERPTTTREKTVPNSTRSTAAEAAKHQAELLEEEEKLKKQKEKRKERKKRRKARKKQEKEVRYGGGDSKRKGKKETVAESSDDDEEDEGEIENKENIKTNDFNTETTKKPVSRTSSEDKAPSTSPEVEGPSMNNLKSHLEASYSHRKEVHGGNPREDGRGEGGGEAGRGDQAKPSEGKKNHHKSKKAVHTQNIPSDSESDEETQGLDVNSAFFARAASGVTKKQSTPPAGKPKKKSKGKKEESESIEDMDPQILESRKLAVKGNEMANIGNYQEAVKFFTKAIDLNPSDFRFFGNRSFCFDHLQKYDHALRDADLAISLDSKWPKGYYRKGRALSGLKLYSDAEGAFEQVLKLDKTCAEAIQELRTVRVYRLMEMGFDAQQSEAAILQFGTVQAALENLLSQGDLPVNGELDEVYVSDEEDFIMQTIQESKLDSRNPENLRSLWIGNLQPTVTEKELKDLFKPYGEVVSMRQMAEKYCAFVNYKEPRMASRAMDKLQGRALHGKHLLIKFPDNPIDPSVGHPNRQEEYVDPRFKTMILRKNTGSSGGQSKNKQQHQPPVQSRDPASKMTGPVNGDECYFWRTTGCWYSDRCHFKHLPASKGADKK